MPRKSPHSSASPEHRSKLIRSATTGGAIGGQPCRFEAGDRLARRDLEIALLRHTGGS